MYLRDTCSSLVATSSPPRRCSRIGASLHKYTIEFGAFELHVNGATYGPCRAYTSSVLSQQQRPQHLFLLYLISDSCKFHSTILEMIKLNTNSKPYADLCLCCTHGFSFLKLVVSTSSLVGGWNLNSVHVSIPCPCVCK